MALWPCGLLWLSPFRKMWFQFGDPKIEGFRKYYYTGWQYEILPATANVADAPVLDQERILPPLELRRGGGCGLRRRCAGMVQKCAACSAGGAELAQDLLGGRTLGVYRCGEDAVIKILGVNS